jgi:hypothetical protein
LDFDLPADAVELRESLSAEGAGSASDTAVEANVFVEFLFGLGIGLGPEEGTYAEVSEFSHRANIRRRRGFGLGGHEAVDGFS